jgi:hypothetical protein
MYTSSIKLSALAAAVLATLTSAGQNEQVMLANCVAPNDANYKSSWMGYYGNRGGQAPSATAQVRAPSGQTTWWEGSSVSATFSDGDVFSVSIPQQITDQNAYVGTGKNNYGLISCWRQSHPNAFTASSGDICSGIYACNNGNPLQSGLQAQMTFGSGSAPFDGDVNPWDIFHTVWDQRQATQCSTNAVSIGGASIDSSNGCTITFNCYGATDWTVTNGMAQALVGPIGSAVKTKSTYTTKDCVDINDIT